MKVVASIVLLGLMGFAASKESQFFKEILQGRCYDRPPSGHLDECPAIVASFVGVLESHLDADIQTEDFQPYLETADFSSPANRALIWPKVMREEDESSPLFRPPPNLVSPEDTPGGALVRDLAFCGVDQRENCSVKNSHAYWTFWEAAYAKFASQVKGKLQIVLEQKADVVFLERSLVSNLNNGNITSITIYNMEGCSAQESASLTNAFHDAGVSEITCKDDIVEFILCQVPESVECTKYLWNTSGANQDVSSNSNMVHSDDASTADISTTSTSKEGEKHHHFAMLFLFSSVVVVGIVLFFLQRKRLGYHSVADQHKVWPTGERPQ